MKLTDVPNRLRELADAIELADFQDRNVHVSIDSYDRIATRDELALWANFIKQQAGKCSVVRQSDSRWLKGNDGNVDIQMFFERGLLGGKVVEVVEDDDAGLASLLAEAEVPAEVEAA